MSVYMSDQEQIQMIKNWWRENGKFTIAAIVIALLTSYGWRYWQSYHIKKNETASVIYEQMLDDIANYRSNDFKNHANTLMTEYTKTPYASMAAFMWAKTAVEKNNLQLADTKLRWILDHSKNPDVKQIARIREARILLSLHQPQQALAMIEKVEIKSYLPLINEVKGDIYLELGRNDDAKKAYQESLSVLPKSTAHRSFLQMKVDQLNLNPQK